MMSLASSNAIRTLFIVLGLVNIFLGINVAVGEILTLGWQGKTDFVEITDEHVFLQHDSHTGFFGGLYIGIGAFLILGSTNLLKYHTALKVMLALMFVGGVMMMLPDIIFGPDIIASLLAELVLMPILIVWLSRIVSLD